MRVRVLPRETASAVITGALSAMGWGVAAAVLLLTVPVLVDTLAIRGRLDELPLLLLLLGVILGGVVAVALRPRPIVAVGYLVVAGLTTLGYQVVLLVGDPGLIAETPYVVNRPTLALVLVGIPATRALFGILWGLLGVVTATVVGMAAAAIADLPYTPGWGALLAFTLLAVAYGTLGTVQAVTRRRVPNFDALESETVALARGEDLARRTTAIVHDTLLNDLAVVINAPDSLDDRTRERLRSDLATLRSAEWLSVAPVAVGDRTGELRNALGRLVSEFQWRGLTINVTADRETPYHLDPETGAALEGAIRACLENVLRHAGTGTAEIEGIVGDGRLTVMITDQGVGFDPEAVPRDRLGLRTSVRGRIEAVGGEVHLWSSPGTGTSVMLAVPSSPHPEGSRP